MQKEDKPEFGKLLADVMAGYGKPLPDGVMVNVWFNMLAPFAPQVIAAAFSAYVVDRPDYAPVPNSIAARCRLLDGRPGVEEAWAIALTSRDEADTGIWTAEAAEAFALCRPVLDGGDEVGARMAFKDAYLRLVAAARAASKPAEWSASMGWDQKKRIAALMRAATAGMLRAPQATALLAGPADDPAPDNNARAQIASIRKVLAESAAAKERRLQRAEQERMGDEMAKDIEIAQLLAQYQERKP
jgi:hypothetical protein